MARLKISAGDGHGFMNGSLARIWIDDVEVSSSVSKVVLLCDAGAPIQARITFFLTEIDAELPAGLKLELDKAAV